MCRALLPPANRSFDWPKVVGGVAGEHGEVVAQPQIGLGAGQSLQQLCPGEPAAALWANRGEHRDGAAADGDGDVLAGLHAAQHPGRIVAQVT